MSESNGAADGPRTFRDATGQLWVVRVTVAGLKRVRDMTGVDVSRMTPVELSEHIGSGVNVADVAYALCKPDAERLGLSDEQFGEQLAGEHILDAQKALWRSWADFSPPHTRRLMLRLSGRVWGETATADGLTSSTSASNSPAPPGATPTPAPSAS